MYKRIKFLFFSILIIGCQNNTIEDHQAKTFNLKKLPEVTTVKLSDLGFIDIEYVPLETTQQSLIPRTIDVSDLLDRLIFDRNYFILRQFNTILIFRNNGSFIARIGKEGRGPDEFQACHDVEIDKNGLIYIVDGGERKVYVFSEKGEFIRTIKFPLSGVVEYRYINGLFLCYSENHMANVENSYNLIDTEGRIIKSFPNHYSFTKYKKQTYGFSHENLFYRFNNKLFKKEIYSDTIYTYLDLEFKPYLVIEVGDRLLTPKARSETPGLDLAKKYISPRNLFEFGDYIYYEFTYRFDFSKSLIYSFIGSKRNGFQALIDPFVGLVNDLDGGPNILPLTIYDDNTIVGWVEANQLKAYVSSEGFKKSTTKYPKKKKELEILANSLNETDNPILILVSLNKIKILN